MDLVLMAMLSVTWFFVGWRLRPVWEQLSWDRQVVRDLRAVRQRKLTREWPHPTVNTIETD